MCRSIVTDKKLIKGLIDGQMAGQFLIGPEEKALTTSRFLKVFTLDVCVICHDDADSEGIAYDVVSRHISFIGSV